MLARLAPETGAMQLKTSVLLAPIMNPVDVAENAGHIDHISHGRLVLGMSVGYREKELEAVGLTRKDRAHKLEETIEVLKLLWTADKPKTYKGRYIQVTEGRMGF